MVPWNAARAKVQIRLSIQRLRTLQEKKLALAKQSRREIADLLTKGRIETARLRVEGLIQDDIYVELLELLELYSEKLQARFNLLDASSGPDPEPSISDAVCAIVFAAPRTELKELQVLREILMHKYGRTFALSLQSSETAPDTVPPRIASKLSLYTPSKDLVDAYLSEIARGYGVKWVPDHEREEAKLEGNGQGIGEDEDDVDDIDDARAGAGAGDSGSGGTGGPGEGQQKEPSTVLETAKNRTPVLPAAPTYPAGQEKDAWSIEQTRGGAGVAPGGGGVGGGKKLSEEEELAQRFERLKNLR